METLLKEFKSFSEEDSSKVADYLFSLLSKKKTRFILLSGNLGGGKTFLTQKLGNLLGVKENINSPTFNLMKLYSLHSDKVEFKRLLHIDAYRLDSVSDLLAIGLEEYLENPAVLLMVEWPKDLKDYLLSKKMNFYFVDIEILSMSERAIRVYENKF